MQAMRFEMDLQEEIELKERYLRRAINDYEYSFALEYDKSRMTTRAVKEGTVDFDYHNSKKDVEVSRDGAWVRARVWVPKEGIDAEK
jgi:hypothetical protein